MQAASDSVRQSARETRVFTRRILATPTLEFRLGEEAPDGFDLGRREMREPRFRGRRHELEGAPAEADARVHEPREIVGRISLGDDQRRSLGRFFSLEILPVAFTAEIHDEIRAAPARVDAGSRLFLDLLRSRFEST